MKPIVSLLITMYVISVLGCRAAVERQRVEDLKLCADSLSLDIPSRVGTLTVEAGVAMPGVGEGRGDDSNQWHLVLCLIDGGRITLTVGWGNSDYGDFNDMRYMYVTTGDGRRFEFNKNVDLYRGENIMLVEVDDHSVAHVYIGNDILNHVDDIKLPVPLGKVILGSGQCLDVVYCSVEAVLKPCIDSQFDDAFIDAACTVTDQAEPLGLWHALDRDNDASYARPGGNYTLLVVEDYESPGDFLILYIDGAIVNDQSWHRGMIKGRLSPIGFDGRYRLEWYGADMKMVNDEAHAIIENGIMTLNFPLLHAQLRYSR